MTCIRETPRDRTRHPDMYRGTPVTERGKRGAVIILLLTTVAAVVAPVHSSFPKRIPIGNSSFLVLIGDNWPVMRPTSVWKQLT